VDEPISVVPVRRRIHEGSTLRDFLLDSVRGAPWSRGGNALKVPRQRPTFAAPRTIALGRWKNDYPSRKRTAWTLAGGAETGV
jgi:hypothetical protein